MCIRDRTKKVMLLSFKSWPTLEPNFKKLVNAGFYYTGVGSKLSCIECRVILNGWKCSDDPWTVHEKVSPHCFLVKIHKDEDCM